MKGSKASHNPVRARLWIVNLKKRIESESTREIHLGREKVTGNLKKRIERVYSELTSLPTVNVNLKKRIESYRTFIWTYLNQSYLESQEED